MRDSAAGQASMAVQTEILPPHDPVEIGAQRATTPVARPRSEGAHRIQLDGIRALAVAAVLAQHFDPGLGQWIDVGAVGVRVFFVLSGFLITGILLGARSSAEIDGSSKWHVLRNFYARRFLRIFPIYYLVILLAWTVHIRSMRQSVGWHLAYLSNIYFFHRGIENYSVTHFWTLAVEEQFYLVWPLLILFLPRKWLLGTVISAICIGPLFRAAVVIGGGNNVQTIMLMPECLDTLGMGALLATLNFLGMQRIKQRFLGAALVIGAASYFALAVITHFRNVPVWNIPFGLAVALWGVWLIDGAYTGFRGLFGRILSFKPAVYLGTISYGVYLIHNFIPVLVNRTLGYTSEHEMPMPIRPIVMVSVTVALASISWFGFERPINSLKRFFPYTRRG